MAIFKLLVYLVYQTGYIALPCSTYKHGWFSRKHGDVAGNMVKYPIFLTGILRRKAECLSHGWVIQPWDF